MTRYAITATGLFALLAKRAADRAVEQKRAAKKARRGRA